jgi:hypothetical protein
MTYGAVYDNIINNNSNNNGILLHKFKHCIEMHVERSLVMVPLRFYGFPSDS